MLLYLSRSKLLHPPICTVPPTVRMHKSIYLLIQKLLQIRNPKGMMPLHTALYEFSEKVLNLEVFNHMQLIAMQFLVQLRICAQSFHKGDE